MLSVDLVESSRGYGKCFSNALQIYWLGLELILGRKRLLRYFKLNIWHLSFEWKGWREACSGLRADASRSRRCLSLLHVRLSPPLRLHFFFDLNASSLDTSDALLSAFLHSFSCLRVNVISDTTDGVHKITRQIIWQCKSHEYYVGRPHQVHGQEGAAQRHEDHFGVFVARLTKNMYCVAQNNEIQHNAQNRYEKVQPHIYLHLFKHVAKYYYDTVLGRLLHSIESNTSTHSLLIECHLIDDIVRPGYALVQLEPEDASWQVRQKQHVDFQLLSELQEHQNRNHNAECLDETAPVKE